MPLSYPEAFELSVELPIGKFTVTLFHSNLDEKITSNEQKVTSNEQKVQPLFRFITVSLPINLSNETLSWN